MGIQLAGPQYHGVRVVDDEEESPGGSPTHHRGALGHSSASLGKFHSWEAGWDGHIDAQEKSGRDQKQG